MNLFCVRKAVFLIFALLMSSVAVAEAIWIDVRTPAEHLLDNISGDIRISHEDILPEVTQRYPDKSADIHLYCKSGKRAGIAMSKLKEAGYMHVVNAGGIDDARKERGLLN